MLKGKMSEDTKAKIPPILLFGNKSSQTPTIDSIYGDKIYKQRLEDIVLSMSNPMVFGCLGVDAPKSYLFTGPPGTGKTFAVKAIVNSMAKTMKNDEHRVAYVKYDIGTVGTAYINMGAVNMTTMFELGKQLLTTEPRIRHLIYFLDECDAIMGHRGNGHASKEDDKTLEALMKNLQEVNDRGLNEYIFMATNFPDALDEASIRSGRVNGRLEFKLPDDNNRYHLIKGYLEAQNELVGYKVFRSYNIDELVALSKGFNCADINQCIQNSIQNKIKRELRVKPQGVIPAWYITQKGLAEEFNVIKARKTPEKRRIGFQV